jgi:ubiquinone/menaquinone biosynthesis C-methylase UbiE
VTDRESLIAESPAKLSFDDSAAYERFVGTWGRAAGSMFLQWLDPPRSADRLDVGCGTGLFTELIVRSCAPASVIGIDPAPTQINYASRKPIAAHASFRTGDAEALPLRDATFDIVASALVINFIPDRPRALSEMSRVARPGGLVGGYIWDFEAELSPSGPFRLALRDLVRNVPPLPGTEDSAQARLRTLFKQAGFVEVATRSFEVAVEFPDFDAFWTAQTPSYAPTTRIIADMDDRSRRRLREAVRARVQPGENGLIRYSARANAVRGKSAKGQGGGVGVGPLLAATP